MTQPVPRTYTNRAVNTTIASGNFGATTTDLIAASNSGYPTSYPFTIRINPGAADEEIVDVDSGLGTVANPWKVTRARDDTIAKAWALGTPIVHGFSARDFREMQESVVGAQSLISNAFPIGGILLWYGSSATVPRPKYAICDGQSYNQNTGQVVTDPKSPGAITTPDLRNRFVYGASAEPGGKAPDVKAGSNAMTAANMPRHNHSTSVDSHWHEINMTFSAHSHQMRKRDGNRPVDSATGFSYPIDYTLTGPYTSFSTGGFYSGTDGTHRHDCSIYEHNHDIGFTGGGGAPNENNMPQYYVLYYIMRVSNA